MSRVPVRPLLLFKSVAFLKPEVLRTEFYPEVTLGNLHAPQSETLSFAEQLQVSWCIQQFCRMRGRNGLELLFWLHSAIVRHHTVTWKHTEFSQWIVRWKKKIDIVHNLKKHSPSRSWIQTNWGDQSASTTTKRAWLKTLASRMSVGPVGMGQSATDLISISDYVRMKQLRIEMNTHPKFVLTWLDLIWSYLTQTHEIYTVMPQNYLSWFATIPIFHSSHGRYIHITWLCMCTERHHNVSRVGRCRQTSGPAPVSSSCFVVAVALPQMARVPGVENVGKATGILVEFVVSICDWSYLPTKLDKVYSIICCLFSWGWKFYQNHAFPADCPLANVVCRNPNDQQDKGGQI